MLAFPLLALFIFIADSSNFTCPKSCKSGCGAGARNCNVQDSGSCTPFKIQPNIDDSHCANWRDWQRFSTTPFFRYSDVNSYQAWRSIGANDTWVVHGCDGSGIQTDCRGDVLYLEWFGNPSKLPAPDCPAKSYPNNEPCPGFNHPGRPSGYVSFDKYSCGWWRGYKQASDSNLENSAHDAGLFGTAGRGGDYSAKLKKVLANCPTCPGGTALKNPFQFGAKAYFAGGFWPWVCSHGGGKNMQPYTGKSNLNCYCNNEPQNGRGKNPIFPYSTTYLYCGLFEYDGLDVMTCNLITLVQEGTNVPTESEILVKNFDLHPVQI